MPNEGYAILGLVAFAIVLFIIHRRTHAKRFEKTKVNWDDV